MISASIIKRTELKRNYMIAADNHNRKAIVIMEDTIKKKQNYNVI